MIDIIALLLGPFLLGFLLPFRWGLRLVGLMLLAIAFWGILEPRPFDPDWGYDLVVAAAGLVGLMAVSGVCLNAVMTFIYLRTGSKPVRDRPYLGLLDRVVTGLVGVWLGCAAFWGLAVWFQGHPAGLALHWVIAALAALCLVGFMRTRLRWLMLGFGLTLGGLALDGGLRYPDIIVARADARSDGSPYCLMLGADFSLPQTRAQLMALTLEKTHAGRSSVLLLVEGAHGRALYRWSFRGRDFVELRSISATGHEEHCRAGRTPIPLD